MSQIQIENIQNGSNASGNDVNSRFATVVKLVNGNLDGTNIADGSIGTAELANGAITEEKIADRAISYNKLPEKHRLYRHYSGSGGAVYPGGQDTDLFMQETADIFGITIDNDKKEAYINRTGVYTITVQVTTTDVPSGTVPYIDIYFPIGYLGSTSVLVNAFGYDMTGAVSANPVYSRKYVTGTFYLPEGTKVKPRVAVRGPQTRLGTDPSRLKTDSFISIYEV